MPYQTPAEYDGPRLTDEQRALAADPKGLKQLRSVVRHYARRFPQYADDIESAAYYAAARAAMTYNPEAGAWTTHLIWRVKAEIYHAFSRQTRPIGYRQWDNVWADIPKTAQASVVIAADDGEPATLENTFVSGDLPVGWEIESEDEVRKFAGIVLGSGRRHSPGQRDAILYEFLSAEAAATPSHGRENHSKRTMAKSQAIGKLRHVLRPATLAGRPAGKGQKNPEK